MNFFESKQLYFSILLSLIYWTYFSLPSFHILWFLNAFVFWPLGCLDVVLMFGAYTSARGMAISRLVIRFFWCGFSSVFVLYMYLWVHTLGFCRQVFTASYTSNSHNNVNFQETFWGKKEKLLRFTIFSDLCTCIGCVCWSSHPFCTTSQTAFMSQALWNVWSVFFPIFQVDLSGIYCFLCSMSL